MKLINKLWIGIGVLIFISPIGLILPEHFKAGSAWGEWGGDEIQKFLGYMPEGFEKLSSLWNAPMPDYAFKGWEVKGLGPLSFAYILSAVIGVLLCVGAVWILGKFLSKK